jgi:hypothetical protein
MSIRKISVDEHLARAANARESVAKRMAAIAERRATRVAATLIPEIDPQTGAAVLTVVSRRYGRTFRVLIDAEDWDRVNAREWFVTVLDRGRLVFSSRKVLLHRFVMNAPDGVQVDHIHHDYCDLRKSELRFASQSQNAMNSRKQQRDTTSRFKGVSWYPRFGKWRASFNPRNVGKHLGYCPGTPAGEVDCARLYDSAAREAYGEFALTNFA